MSIPLTPELERFVQTQVESGRYSSATEVAIAGIAMLKSIDRLYQGRYEELKDKVMEGMAAADKGELIDSETVFKTLQDRLDQKRQNAS